METDLSFLVFIFIIIIITVDINMPYAVALKDKNNSNNDNNSKWRPFPFYGWTLVYDCEREHTVLVRFFVWRSQFLKFSFPI